MICEKKNLFFAASLTTVLFSSYPYVPADCTVAVEAGAHKVAAAVEGGAYKVAVAVGQAGQR